MTKKQREFLEKLHNAREVMKTHERREVKLVTGVYDSMLHHFGTPEMMDLSDEEYAYKWNSCRYSVKMCLVVQDLISADTFDTIWNAYDVITLEQAEAFA